MDVCVAVPRLELDRPFTYRLGEDQDGGTGSLVSVTFHGRTVRGWILGPATGPPPARTLPVRAVRSAVRFFDPALLELFRWMSRRYLAPLATIIERSHPPRVAGEERNRALEPPSAEPPAPAAPAAPTAAGRYGEAAALLEPGTTTWLRPLPGDEVEACAWAVAACVAGGRCAVVIVPEADPLPATAAGVLERFGPRAARFLGGAGRERYRTWLDVGAGRYDVVVGTRPAVFAPLADLGLLWISREVHPAHREDRSPYHHVREVAAARARIAGAACVLASLAPSVETAEAVRQGTVRTARAPRDLERRLAPLVEAVAPQAEDRSPRLGALLKRVRSAALIVSRRGYGVARVCRTCGEPAACAACRGPIVIEAGHARCRVCGARGRCANCDGVTFGVERGGTERIAEWAGRISGRPVDLEVPGAPPPSPAPGRVLVGTAAAVKDVGSAGLDLVAILDPDRALARPGIHAGEQALATWMEAAAWAGPRQAGGRVLLHTRRPGHPAVQSLVRWDPLRFLGVEARQRSDAGFPAGHPSFRITGTSEVELALRTAGAETVLAAPGPEGTLCLVAVSPGSLPRFRDEVLRLAERGVVSRVEAEPTR